VKRRGLTRLDERTLKLVLAGLFFALAVPAAVLIAQAYDQLKWQAFRSTQVAAEELAARVDAALRAAIAAEDARSFGDYSFLVVTGDAAANFVQRSPLSSFPVASAVPGVLGYFQVDAAGRLTTPLLPEGGVVAATYGIAPAEEAARAQRVAQLRELLVRNELARPAREEPAAPPEGERSRREFDALSDLDASAQSVQARFDRLAEQAAAPAAVPPSRDDAVATLEQVAAPAANAPPPQLLQSRTAFAAEERQKRREESLVAEPAAAAPAVGAVAGAADEPVAKVEVNVRTFASEVDPFELGVLDADHLVLFRNVWRDGQRYVQGALVERAAFVEASVAGPYRASSLTTIARLSVALQGRVLGELPTLDSVAYSEGAPLSDALAGTSLYRARLSPPFGDLELAFVVDRLPRAPGSALLAWVAVTLAAVLVGGFVFMYRFGVGQMRLARQQQDFVSAVSHELKTPLTSIRMYGEMLKAGWADEAKRQTYYDYIHSESERLSRLIENVLQLARLTRNTQRFDMRISSVAELVELVRSKVATQVERAGFELVVRDEAPPGTAVVVDADCFTQIFINLVDNALKFSTSADSKIVEIAARRVSDGVLFTVRDYGPGVPNTQMKKIFELFYRAENELTRETVGTGIGLALVRQLAGAMGARVDVRNCEPGAEFRLQFPRAADVNG
jgi:signal transduction histidine kinase